MNWNFKREETQFETIPEGEHRCRIKEVEKAISQAGNDMLIVKLEVSGYKGLLFHYITFMNDRPEITNRMLTQLFDSFAIEDGDFNIANWAGKAGGVMVRHDDEDRAKVHYFLNKKRQESLPAWKDAEGGSGASDMQPVDDTEDLPF